jgi:hypothetical protein
MGDLTGDLDLLLVGDFGMLMFRLFFGVYWPLNSAILILKKYL